MEKKFTKGPWNYSKPLKKHFQIIDSNGDSVAEANALFEEAEANAKLIAAAPDLLEALEDLVFTATKLFEEVSPIKSGNGVNVTHPIIEQAKEAIKKALS